MAAGKKSKLPIAIRSSPKITIRLYPIFFVRFPAGIENTRYAIKKEDARSCAEVSVRPKIAFTGALRVTIKVVAKPKIKKMAPKAVIPTL